MTTINLSDAKDKLSQLVKETAETTGQVVISVNGRNQVVLISMEEYESLMETIDILKDQALVKKISLSMADIQKKNVISFEDIRKD
ncbi:MAG: type II toxin-antitoxin system Phd/YefM family antitoxin [Candidatus Omnitrophica bacterium]|nr:type II toxin-antitoxin system Phd/YefM family antitoxin [Candidatus Omnitrophota bacterium]